MRRLLAALLLALPALPAAAGWQFDDAVEVSAARPGVFHHLEASGRKAIAVSGGVVAVVWEDNRDGAPRCRLGVKPRTATAFREYGFGRGECYEPGIAALDGGRFALIWEDADGVAAALAGESGIDAPLALAARGGQAALAWHPALGLFAAWSSREGRWQRLYRARLGIEGGLKPIAAPEPADAAAPADDQLHPSLAATRTGVTLAWEDRRLGHTVIFTSTSRDGGAWTPPTRLSQNPTGRAQGDLGRGTGAMRPALAAYGPDGVAAVWLDKRDFLSGYDVYAALSADGGARFGANTKAQDSFGDAIAQWHAAAAGDARGDLVLAWDDERDGSPDIWLTWLTAYGFAENQAPPPASGPGSQTEPAVALDAAGELHLAWIERAADGTTRLRYALGRRGPD